MPERENLRREFEPGTDRRSEASRAMNRAVILPETVSVAGPQTQRAQHVANIQQGVVQERVVRQIRMLRAMRRELETGLR